MTSKKPSVTDFKILEASFFDQAAAIEQGDKTAPPDVFADPDVLEKKAHLRMWRYAAVAAFGVLLLIVTVRVGWGDKGEAESPVVVSGAPHGKTVVPADAPGQLRSSPKGDVPAPAANHETQAAIAPVPAARALAPNDGALRDVSKLKAEALIKAGKQQADQGALRARSGEPKKSARHRSGLPKGADKTPAARLMPRDPFE